MKLLPFGRGVNRKIFCPRHVLPVLAPPVICNARGPGRLARRPETNPQEKNIMVEQT